MFCPPPQQLLAVWLRFSRLLVSLDVYSKNGSRAKRKEETCRWNNLCIRVAYKSENLRGPLAFNCSTKGWFVASFCWDILAASALHLCVNVCFSCVLNYIRAVKGKCMAQQESTVWRASSTCICSAVTKPPEALQPPPVLCFLSFCPAVPVVFLSSCCPPVFLPFISPSSAVLSWPTALVPFYFPSGCPAPSSA